ncbi:MAG: trypsin-like serine protease [Lentisphaerae bacterium]|nr:trypsin-like serine protease [Lentisphaerota bacterium]MBT7055660.1 trypsin-like serine protease [Lentisphaerota bacterium]MBT7846508.1 trypsin-like serine protease [Lentisphaerota bacterium]
MRLISLGLLLLMVWVPPTAGADAAITMTLRDGRVYRDITIHDRTPDSVVVLHRHGRAEVHLTDLSESEVVRLKLLSPEEENEVLLGVNTVEQIVKKRIEAGGLVNYRGEWVTPAQATARQEAERQAKAEREETGYEARADKLVMRRAYRRVRFRVVKVRPDWDLALAEPDPRTEGAFILHSEKRDILTAVDGEQYTADLYWAGPITIPDGTGGTTINCYSNRRDLARRIVRFKFGLHGEQSAEALPPSGDDRSPDSKRAGGATPVRGSGSGFSITDDGFILTNHHVIDGAARITVTVHQGGTVPARVIAKDPSADLALLKISHACAPMTFASRKVAQLGQAVFAIGFPMPGIQGLSPKVTKGIISGSAGPKGNPTRYQIDAAVQPGNSGGPLVDESGHVIGVVDSRINAAMVLREKGKILQNVNYAIKKSYVLAFLEGQSAVADRLLLVSDGKKRPSHSADAIEAVVRSTVLICVY